MLKHELLSLIIISFIILFFCSCSKINESSIQGQTMGTYYIIKYISKSSYSFWKKIYDDTNNILEEINNQMSTYSFNSELSRFNKLQQTNTLFPVSFAVIKVIKAAFYVNKLTNGAFDITIGPLVNLWGFGPCGRITKLPSKKILKLYLQWVGIDKLVINGNNLIKKIPQLYVDLSAIAKGYAVDVISEYLESQDIHNYMINIGGEIRTKGCNRHGVLWRIAIEKPSKKCLDQLVQTIIKPGNMSVATSGSYRNYFEYNGIYYSHIVNPNTGQPIVHNLISTTVIAPTCMMADALSTGVSILGVDKGMKLAESLKLPVFMIVSTNKGFKEYYSSSFKHYLLK